MQALPRKKTISPLGRRADGQCGALGCIGGKPRSGVPAHSPALTQLCGGWRSVSPDRVPKVRIFFVFAKPGTTA